MIWNNPHQQPSKESMKTSVKIQETNLESKKKLGAAEISAKGKLGEDGDKEEKNNREGRRRLQIFLLLSSLIGPYIKRKEKSKVIFDFGRNYQIVPLVLPTIHTSPNIFQLFNLVLLSSNSLHQ